MFIYIHGCIFLLYLHLLSISLFTYFFLSPSLFNYSKAFQTSLFPPYNRLYPYLMFFFFYKCNKREIQRKCYKIMALDYVTGLAMM